MFNLNCFVDLPNGRPGMLVPLLSSADTNLPYVQQMDEFLLVKDIIPFLEYENYPIVPRTRECVVTIGDRGLIAFRSPDDSIFCGNPEEVLNYIDENQELVASNVLFRAQLNRIESVGLERSYDIWRHVAEIKFDDERQRSLWVASEFRFYKKQSQIWTEIDPGEVDTKKSTKPGLQRPLSEYSSEHLVGWLSIRSNYFVKGWTAVWHHVNARLPADDRVSLLGINWMYALNEEDTDLQLSKSILFGLLHRSKKSKDVNWEELAEFVLERLIAEPYLIYSFMKPRSLFPELLFFLTLFGSVDYVLRLVEFCIQNVPKEEHVVAAMEMSLEIILNEQLRDDSPSDPRRELEAKEGQIAWDLLRQVRTLPNR
jgi:hypothetical protein